MKSTLWATVLLAALWSAPALSVTDTDGDGVPDGTDNCTYVPNFDQADADQDFAGNVCDLFPLDADNDLAQCRGNIEECKAELRGCQAGLVPDADVDGVPDSTETCPGTPANGKVDAEGCSLLQFCAKIDATTRAGELLCKKQDWLNDEPLMTPNQVDCTLGRGATSSRADDVCVPAPDGDSDGVLDVVDACANTRPNVPVDAQGCALNQFCGLIDATTRAGELSCKKQDWLSDEPSMTPPDADCTLGRGHSPDRSDDRCVPAPGARADDHAACDAQLVQCENDLLTCRTTLDPGDADGDGILNGSDTCPSTPVLEQVDAEGCSLPQFCAKVDATNRAGELSCRKADWKNDEPLMTPAQADCAVGRGATSSRADDVCVPSPDADHDGVSGHSDDCPATPKGAEVDDRGCSLSEFCARIVATSHEGEFACKAVDWKGDEPSTPPGDCVLGRGLTPSRSDDVCVPAP